jgi:hypothetical protein
VRERKGRAKGRKRRAGLRGSGGDGQAVEAVENAVKVGVVFGGSRHVDGDRWGVLVCVDIIIAR